ncbi:ABC transporter permease [Clostridium sp. AM58-1XD]|uniref:ABC transporter permease n=1 Tax=Clostridium sp. AM58-1XD TaxID=2292307 RepID=UPI000E522537|nr:ABC transporter permease [Clostridium sp. AM58-1XD]RGY98072.1 ABC transporter permease [Clostridium sp. AM58-1XD]
MLQQIFTMTFLTAFLTAAVRMAVPLIYAGLGETFLEKAGILNIGMEGVMLGGAFFSFAGAFFSGNIFIGLLCGMLGGMAVSAIHGYLCIKLSQNQSVSGIALNIFMLGVTSFLYKLMSAGQSYQQVTTLSAIEIPLLSKIPLVGNAFFNQDILTYLVYVLVVLAVLFYKKTGAGLAFTAIGEHPRAADAAGIPVYRYQWAAIAVNGMLGGIGGACLVLVQLGKFTENMISGRGYIALAAVILGRYTPLGMFGAALVFGGANALQIRLQAMGVPLPTQALAMLPYIITLVALLGSIGKSSEPEALGIPYVRGSR